MVPVYFAHSYRDEDRRINEHFLNLMKDKGFSPCVDIPSNRLNAAKQERQLGFAAALVAVLPYRSGGPSPYILSEISMAVRSGKPALVFTEDTIGSGNFSERVLKDRFSRKSFWRSTREHIDALERLHAFVGPTLLPRLRASDKQRSICVLGFEQLPDTLKDAVKRSIGQRQYSLVRVCDPGPEDKVLREEAYANIRDASLVVAFLDYLTPADTYWLGFARGGLIPTIMLHTSPHPPLRLTVPEQLGPRHVVSGLELIQVLETEIDIFEDEAFEMDQSGEINAYIEFLKSASRTGGRYDAGSRVEFIQHIGRDFYNIGEAGAAGPGATNNEQSGG